MGDVGNFIQIAGVIWQGGGEEILMYLPDHRSLETPENEATELYPSVDEWSQVIQHSDDPSIFEFDDTGVLKAIHRKVRFQISGAVQQKVWALDGCKCLYCLRKIGQVQLTIDHFQPLETGGKNDQSNYLTACRKCNKRKGNEDPRTWCAKDTVMFDYDWYVKYLSERPLEFWGT
jgi:hypothetical protein